MTTDEYDVKVAPAKSGAVYAHERKGGQVDNNGKAINSEWSLPVCMYLEA